MTFEPDERAINQSRRSFLTFTPLGILIGVLGTYAVAAFRFLRPVIGSAADQWVDVGAVHDLQGADPIPRKISLQRVEGWATSTQQHTVYVLPQNGNRIVSSICPHEGCEVAWEPDSKRFSCPCHESSFAADGSRIQGPARRGLDALPSRLQDDKLQVQFSFFENNAEEQIKRG